MSEATASIRGEHDSPHGFACIDQHRRDFPVCIIEFENKSDESPFFLFTTFNFRLPASSRMVATSSPYWVTMMDGSYTPFYGAAYAREATSTLAISQASGNTLASRSP